MVSGMNIMALIRGGMMRRVGSLLSRSGRRASVASVGPTPSMVNESNGAVFIAIDFDQQALIPRLIEAGADLEMKHPEAHMLAPSYLIAQRGRSAVSRDALMALLQRRCEIDESMADMIRRRMWIKLVDAKGVPIRCGEGAHVRRLDTAARARRGCRSRVADPRS